MNKTKFNITILVISLCFFLVQNTSFAARRASTIRSYSYKAPRYTAPKSYSFKSSRRAYQPKKAYEGFGKSSAVNGLPKTKITSGHGKRTSKGYTYVSPYARSK